MSVVEVNEAAVYSTQMGVDWWNSFRARFDPIGRITDRDMTPVGGRASVACESYADAQWLALHMVEHGGLPKTAVKAKRATA